MSGAVFTDERRIPKKSNRALFVNRGNVTEAAAKLFHARGMELLSGRRPKPQAGAKKRMCGDQLRAWRHGKEWKRDLRERSRFR